MKDSGRDKKEIFEEVDRLRQRLAQLQGGTAKKTEQLQLPETEQAGLVQSLVDSIPDKAWIKNAQGKFVLVNKALSEAFGMSPDELIGKNDFEVSPKDLAEKYVSDDKEVMATGKRKCIEEQWGRKEGKRISLETIKTPIYNQTGEVIGVSGIARDITKRKKAEEQLRDSESKFRTLYASTSDAVMLLDRERFFDCNEATLRMFGLESLKEFCTNHPADLSPPRQPGGEDSRKLAMNRIEQGFREGSVCFEWLHSRKDGTEFPAEVLLTAMNLGSKRVLQAVVRDIAERKEYEAALEQARSDLEKRVKERTKELQRINEELEKEVSERRKVEEELLRYQQELRSLASELTLSEERLKRRMAINVHDGIGQLLATSKMRIETLRQMGVSEEHSKSLSEISRQLGEAIESSRLLTMELSPPALYELGFASALEWLVNRSREQYFFSVEFESDGRIEGLEKDVKVLVFQAVRELLLNIAKHSKASEAMVKAFRRGDSIEVSVEDNGVGFEISRVRFGGKGTGGFGLFSIRERLGYLGGRFDIKSQPGAGTSVVLSVPCSGVCRKAGDKDKKERK